MDSVFVVQITECGISCVPNTYKRKEDAIEFLEECLERKGVKKEDCEITVGKNYPETTDLDLVHIVYAAKDICGEIIETELR